MAYCLPPPLFFPYETMLEMNHDKTNLIQALKHYNACILLSIITVQALFSWSIPMFSSSQTLPWLLPILGGAVVLLHVLGVFNYYMALKKLDLLNLKFVALYLVLPLGNLYVIIELSKMINSTLEQMELEMTGNISTSLKNVGLGRVYSFADIKTIEKRMEVLGM